MSERKENQLLKDDSLGMLVILVTSKKYSFSSASDVEAQYKYIYMYMYMYIYRNYIVQQVIFMRSNFPSFCFKRTQNENITHENLAMCGNWCRVFRMNIELMKNSLWTKIWPHVNYPLYCRQIWLKKLNFCCDMEKIIKFAKSLCKFQYHY